MLIITLISISLIMTLIFSCLIIASQTDDEMEEYFKNKKELTDYSEL